MSDHATAIVHVDAEGCVAEVDVDAALAGVEHAARAAGLTVGLPTPGSAALTVRAFLEGRHAGLRVAPGGRLEPLPVAVRGRFADGATFQSRFAPRRATGPDLLHLVLGCDGRFAALVAATLRLLPIPEAASTLSRRFAGPREAVGFVAGLARAGAPVAEAAVDGDRVTVKLAGQRFELALFAEPDGGKPDDGVEVAPGGFEAACGWDALPAALAACEGRAFLARVSAAGAVACVEPRFAAAIEPHAAPLSGPPRLSDFERRFLDRVAEALP